MIVVLAFSEHRYARVLKSLIFCTVRRLVLADALRSSSTGPSGVHRRRCWAEVEGASASARDSGNDGFGVGGSSEKRSSRVP